MDMTARPWAIHGDPAPLPAALPHAPPADAPDADLAHAQGAGDAVTGDVAILRLTGVLEPRAPDWVERLGWGTGVEQFTARLEAAARDAKAVMVLVDSPGGSAAGLTEAARRVAAVAAVTPVVAVASYIAASGAYWLAAACTAVVCAPSALVGSVGVRMLRPSYARRLDADGVDLTVITRGAGKTDMLTWVELTTEGEQRLQRIVDVCYDDFVAAVAAGRGVPATTVTDQWGAQLMPAGDAAAAGMVDEVATAEAVVASLGTEAGRGVYRRLHRRRSATAAFTHVIHPGVSWPDSVEREEI